MKLAAPHLFVSVCVAATALTVACRTSARPILYVRTVADTVRIDTIRGAGVALIRVQLRNPSRDAITIGYCEQYLQQLQSNVWKTVQLQACAGPAPAWRVPARDSILIAYMVDDSRDMRIIVRRGPLVTGQYRLLYQGFFQSDSTRLTNFHSAPFVIVVSSTARR